MFLISDSTIIQRYPRKKGGIRRVMVKWHLNLYLFLDCHLQQMYALCLCSDQTHLSFSWFPLTNCRCSLCRNLIILVSSRLLLSCLSVEGYGKEQKWVVHIFPCDEISDPYIYVASLRCPPTTVYRSGGVVQKFLVVEIQYFSTYVPPNRNLYQSWDFCPRGYVRGGNVCKNCVGMYRGQNIVCVSSLPPKTAAPQHFYGA